MKKLIPLFLLAACSMSGKVVTMDTFYEVDISTPTAQVIETMGQPYAKVQMPDGSVEYEYIERIKIGGRDAEERHYYILIKDGRVASKRVRQGSPLPFGFDSYEMQTTQNGDSSSLE